MLLCDFTKVHSALSMSGTWLPPQSLAVVIDPARNADIVRANTSTVELGVFEM